MSNFTEEQARAYMHKLLAAMTEAGGSDLFIANDFPPSMKAHGNIRPLTSQKLTGAVTRQLANSVMNERQREEFAREFECNFALAIPGLSRFRVNIFKQRGTIAIVMRVSPWIGIQRACTLRKNAMPGGPQYSTVFGNTSMSMNGLQYWPAPK